MKTLTVHQPWAWGIVQGHKRIENRPMPTRHRGPVLIHAGLSRKSLAVGFETFRRWGVEPPGTDSLTFGSAIGIVRIVDCVPFDEVADQPFAEGPWCWILEGAEPLDSPIRLTGMLGLFNTPNDVVSGMLGARWGRWSGRMGLAPSFPGW